MIDWRRRAADGHLTLVADEQAGLYGWAGFMEGVRGGRIVDALRNSPYALQDKFKPLAALKADRHLMVERIAELPSLLKSVRGDPQAEEPLIHLTAVELAALRADQQGKGELLCSISVELEAERAGPRAKEALSQRIALEIGPASHVEDR